MVLSIVALITLRTSTLGLMTQSDQKSFQQARVLAGSAIDHALAMINSNANWRDPTLGFVIETEYPSTPVSAGGGQFTWKLSDPDGSLNDDPKDAVTITGYGRVNGCTFAQEARASASGNGLTSLNVSICTDKDLNLTGGTLISDQIVASNGGCLASGGVQVMADIEAVDGATGSTYHQNVSSSVARSLPDGGTVLDYYVLHGTAIPITSLPYSGGVYVIDSAVLSPTLNPYGGANAEGIYVIDCLVVDVSYPLTIRDSRILGTLVVLNGVTTIEGTMNWSASVPNFPILLADGDVDIRFDSSQLLSEAALATNFNPDGAPYYGNTDSDFSDVYPSLLRGLVYAGGDVWMSSNPRINGVLVSDKRMFLTSGTTDMIYDSQFLSTPPPGFDGGTGSSISILVGTWKRVVSP